MGFLGCPFCEEDSSTDKKTYERCKLAKGSPCIHCSEAIELDSLIIRTRETLTNLILRRHDLHREINSAHERIIHNLPPEVSASILSFALSDGVPKSVLDLAIPDTSKQMVITTPLTLGAVCPVWRRIVWAEPRLWTNISIPVRIGPNQDVLEIAHEWISRSGQLPLSFYVYASQAAPSHSFVELRHISALIHRYLDRCQRLEFSCPFRLFPPIHGDAPILEEIKIKCDHPQPSFSPISLYSTKSEGVRVSITGCNPSSLEIPFENVGAFEGLITLDECLYTLEKCPGLRVFQILGFTGHVLSSNLGEVVTHNRLERLSLGSLRNPSFIVIEMLNLPSLTHLTASSITPLLIRRFIARSSCNLQYLHLDTPKCGDSGDICELLHSIDSLKELHLIGEDIFDFQVDAVFKALAQNPVIEPSTESSKSVSGPLLPNLSVLGIRFYKETNFLWALAASIFGSWDDLRHPRRRPIMDVQITYDWRIGYAAMDERPHIFQFYRRGDPMEMVPSLFLHKAITRRFLDIAQAGVNVKLYDVYANEDILRLSMEHHNIDIPEWYEIQETSRVSALDEIGTASPSEDSEEAGFTESESNSGSVFESSNEGSDFEECSEVHSDILDATFDPDVGLPPGVTGSTLDCFLNC